MRSGFSMKSGGALASPSNAKALPGSDKLVPNTTIPENHDCAPAHPGDARTNARLATAIRRVKLLDVHSVAFMLLLMEKPMDDVWDLAGRRDAGPTTVDRTVRRWTG